MKTPPPTSTLKVIYCIVCIIQLVESFHYVRHHNKNLLGRNFVASQQQNIIITISKDVSPPLLKLGATTNSDGNDDNISSPLLGGDPGGNRSRRKAAKVGEYNAEERLSPGRPLEKVMLGEPKEEKEKQYSVDSILKELAAIQQQGPQKYCVLGTRHCSFLHQQIIELLAYALVLSGNHVFTSGAGGTHAATIRGALRAERPDLLTVVLPQSLAKQPKESQELLEKVEDIIEMPQNDEKSLDVASRICNSFLLSRVDQLVAFAFHESTTVIEATREAKELELLVTTLFLD